jgi:hypothetical protein
MQIDTIPETVTTTDPEHVPGEDSVHEMVRHAFEEWISAPPYEREVERWPQDETKHSWPGQYKDITVEVAWDAWQEARRENARLRESLAGLVKANEEWNCSVEKIIGRPIGWFDTYLDAARDILSNNAITNPHEN